MLPSQTERSRHDQWPVEHHGIAHNRLGGEDLDQEFFVEWEVPQGPPSQPSPTYQARPVSSSVDLRGVGALLVRDFDNLLTG